MSDWSVDSDVRRFGSRSMRCLVTSPAGPRYAYPFENDAGADVAVTPDTAYVLSCYVNTGPLPVAADIALKVFAEGSTTDELTYTYLDDVTLPVDVPLIAGGPIRPNATRNTILDLVNNPEGWRRLTLRFATTSQSRVRPMVYYGGAGAGTPTVGDTFWIDAVQMEESPIPTPWRPGMVGNAAVLDLNGLLIDGQQGGLLRLRDSAGRTADLTDMVTAGVSGKGFQPWTPRWLNTQTFPTTTNLGAAGGSIAVPMFVDGSMRLRGYRFWQKDTTLVRSGEARLYVEGDDGILRYVPGTAGSWSATASAANARGIGLTGGPIILRPGAYILILRNTHASNTLGIGHPGGSSTEYLGQIGMYTGAGVAALGETIDISSWSSSGAFPSMMLVADAAGLPWS